MIPFRASSLLMVRFGSPCYFLSPCSLELFGITDTQDVAEMKGGERKERLLVSTSFRPLVSSLRPLSRENRFVVQFVREISFTSLLFLTSFCFPSSSLSFFLWLSFQLIPPLPNIIIISATYTERQLRFVVHFPLFTFSWIQFLRQSSLSFSYLPNQY